MSRNAKPCIFPGGVEYKRGLFRHLPIALIACAVLMRALVPTGWMPVFERDGTVRMIICADATVHPKMLMAMGKSHEKSPSGAHHSQPCGFSVLAIGFIEAPTIYPPFQIIAVDVVALLALQAVSVGHGLAAPPPPSTGPPALN